MGEFDQYLDKDRDRPHFKSDNHGLRYRLSDRVKRPTSSRARGEAERATDATAADLRDRSFGVVARWQDCDDRDPLRTAATRADRSIVRGRERRPGDGATILTRRPGRARIAARRRLLAVRLELPVPCADGLRRGESRAPLVPPRPRAADRLAVSTARWGVEAAHPAICRRGRECLVRPGCRHAEFRLLLRDGEASRRHAAARRGVHGAVARHRLSRADARAARRAQVELQGADQQRHGWIPRRLRGPDGPVPPLPAPRRTGRGDREVPRRPAAVGVPERHRAAVRTRQRPGHRAAQRGQPRSSVRQQPAAAPDGRAADGGRL